MASYATDTKDGLAYDKTGDRKMSEHEERVVSETMQEFSQHQLWRNTFAAQWEEVAELILPTSRNTFFYGNWNWPGQKKTDRQVDATGMVALHRFAAIMDSLLTPRNMLWHMLGAEQGGPYESLMKDRNVRLWYENATRTLFAMRYAAHANFTSQNQQVYQSLGAFGNGVMFIDEAVDDSGKPMRGFRYKAVPLGEMFLQENHQGLVDGGIRWFRLTARQAYQKWGDATPPSLKAAYDQKSQTPFNFLHRIVPRPDYEPGRLDARGKPYMSCYVSIEGKCLLGEGGFRKLPIVCSRYDQTPGEVYGRGPAMMVLPALKTLNAEKTTFLKVGHRAADPVLLTNDDGLMDGVSLRPGSMNKGGVDSQGRAMVQILPSGKIEITKEMMDEERLLINDVFLITLFQIMVETPSMTATEVVERINEKGILIAPTAGRQNSEYLGPLIDRELDLAASFGMLPPMPPALKEAKGHYDVKYTSPIARWQRAQEVAGFQRTVQSTLEVVKVTGDPSPFDNFDFDRATVDTASIQGVPESWMADDKSIKDKRKARAQMMQQQAQIQALPAQAAMVKAQAAAAGSASGAPGQQQQPMPQDQGQQPGGV